MLFGTTPSQQALVLMWANIVDHEGMSAVAEVLRNLSPGFRDHALAGPLACAQIPALIERGRRRTEQFFDRIEQQLQASVLAGRRGAIPIADISLLVTTDFAGWVDIVPMQTRPALRRWHERVASRPAAQA